MMRIVDILSIVVEKVSVKKLAYLTSNVDPLITKVWYEYGHYNDIKERIHSYNKDEKFPYPLICLFEDFPIDHSQEGTDGTGNLKIIILYKSDNKVIRTWREEEVFVKVLYPIYEEFLKQLKLSGYFQIYDESKIPHRQINRPHWGDPGLYKNESYIFDAILDGIELNNLQLITYKKAC